MSSSRYDGLADAFPLANFLSASHGLILVEAEELNDGFEYPETIALAFKKP